MNYLRSLPEVLGRVLSPLVCLCIAMAAVAADAQQAVKSEGGTELRLRLSAGSQVVVTLMQARTGAFYPYKDALIWGGDVGELPPSLLVSVRIVSGGETIFIPLSAYGDLGDLKTAAIEKTEQGFRLSLHGGDAAGAYDATLSFSQGFLVSRLVTLREFPDQRREMTSYSFPRR